MKLPAGTPDSGLCPKGTKQTLSAPGDVSEDMISDRGSTPLTSTKNKQIPLDLIRSGGIFVMV